MTASPPVFLDVDGTNIAVRHAAGRAPGVVWLGGYKSDMLGTKAETLAAWTAAEGRAFLRHDYSGHGESGGAFVDGTISRWLTQSLAVFRRYTEGRQVLVGSSMGAWIALRMTQELRKAGEDRVAGLVLLAPAPDFTAELVEPSLAALNTAIIALEEAGEALAAAMRAAEHDPRQQERVEERLFALRAAGRKYDVPVDGLPALAETMASDLAALDESESSLGRLEAEMQAAETAFLAGAQALSQARRGAASRLDLAVKAELPPLKLERARFITRIESDETARGPEGFDRIEFWVETNPGTRPGPMMKVASGGELSRFMLALKVVLAERGSAPTLVFDEIDTGVGGAVADAIGERLARLADRVQVISVTHAPQVAAKAGRHFLIAKSAGEGEVSRTVTRVEALADQARREEIARMLAGASITEEARAAARRLLEAALRG